MIQRASRVHFGLRFALGVVGDFGRNTGPDELTQQALEGAAGDADQSVVAGEFSGTVGVRVIQGGERPSGGVAGDVRVVGLPVAVVSAGHEAGEQGVFEARFGGAGRAHVEVAGVLAKDGGKDCRAERAADEGVSVGCAVALAVALDAGAVVGESVVGLLDAGDDSGAKEGDGVGGGVERELEFLAWY